MKHVVLISCLLITGCARCGSREATPARQKRQTDLRSVLMLAFPEYRGARVTSGEASLSRVVEGPDDEAEASAVKTLTANQFERQGEKWVRAPYQVRVSGKRWVVTVPLDASVVERLYMSPAAMSTSDMTMWFPRGEAARKVEREVFDFRLAYLATADTRAVFLTRQLVRLLLSNGQWQPQTLPADWEQDGGASDLAFDASLIEQSTRGTITIHREGATVSLHYSLVTDEP